MKHIIQLAVVAFCAASAANAATQSELLKEQLAEDLTNTVFQGGIDERPFWNQNATMFMYAPAFDFKEFKYVKKYTFRILTSEGRLITFKADSPKTSLAAVWDKIPVGWTSVECSCSAAYHKVAGTRLFWKSAPFTPGKYPKAAMGYDEAVARGYMYLSNHRFARSVLEDGKPDFSLYHSCYPSKMYASLISAMVDYSTFDNSKSGEALDVAKAAADWLISCSEKKGAPLEYWPPTYMGNNAAAKHNRGKIMLIYPAEVACAYVKLYERTKIGKYLEAAENIAATFLNLQDEEGVWPLILKTEDGKPTCNNKVLPINGTIQMFDALYAATKKEIYRTASDKGLKFMENGPLKTWKWEGQFEDIGPSSGYNNLTKHSACSMAIYLLNRYPGDKMRIRQARELLRFAEDQFVCWETPYKGMGPESYLSDEGYENGIEKWRMPSVFEQYSWYVPIDASAAKLIRTYLALYRAEGKILDLEKAKALADSITRSMNRQTNAIPTHWTAVNEKPHHQWWNCHAASVAALRELYNTLEKAK